MKKLVLFLAVAFGAAMVSCGGSDKAADTAAADTTVVAEVVDSAAADTAAADTTVVAEVVEAAQ